MAITFSRQKNNFRDKYKSFGEIIFNLKNWETNPSRTWESGELDSALACYFHLIFINKDRWNYWIQICTFWWVLAKKTPNGAVSRARSDSGDNPHRPIWLKLKTETIHSLTLHISVYTWKYQNFIIKLPSI